MVAQSLTWLDLAIVFGPHIPLLVPLVLISLVTTRWAHESAGHRRLGLHEQRAEFSKPSTWYVLFSIVCQQALSVAVFAGIGDSGGGSGRFGACVAVAIVPVRWLEVARRWCGECCVRFHQCGCQRGRIRRGRRDLGSTTELPNRSLLSGGDEFVGGNSGAEAKTPSEGSVGSTLETPLLQGSGSEEVEKLGDECVEFRQTGACEFGDRCRFLHV